jgi:hypothetical protein
VMVMVSKLIALGIILSDFVIFRGVTVSAFEIFLIQASALK